ncbi:MAG TPA: efflux transporter outer membrane subunit [Burkholderiales bacterium]|nr:efflux transporter outer membrane subunit [Burkholderiales bacterium]
MGGRSSGARLRAGQSRSWRGFPIGAACAATLLLAGCNLGPFYKRPDLPVPAAWNEPADREAAPWPSADWWRGFRSAELDGYIERARRANYDLAAAMARVREADAQATIAGAALLPSLSGDVNAFKERILTTNNTYINAKQISPELSASYMVDFWGKNRAARQAALAAAAASRNDQATIELTVMTSVAQTYFQIIELRDRLAVAEGNLANAQNTLKGLRRQMEVGIVTALDVAQEETTVATLAAVIPPLRQQLRQMVNALAILIGEAPENLETSAARLADFQVPTVGAGLPSELLARRPDIAEAENQLIAANANIQVARAAFFPSLTLTAAGGVASTALSTLFKGGTGVYSLAASVVAPIFDGGALKGQYEFAKARYDELAANYQKAVISAYGNVENALVALQQTTELERREQAAVNTATRAYNITQAQLRSGTVNILTVLNTQTALFSAQDALVQAKYAHLQAVLGLYNALGGGWQNPAPQQTPAQAGSEKAPPGKSGT